jgi:hypothetical protein
MTDWQPIETYPEGEYVDVWAVYGDGTNPNMQPRRWPAAFRSADWPPPREGGLNSGLRGGHSWQGVAFGWRPTHWAALPQGPNGEKNDYS